MKIAGPSCVRNTILERGRRLHVIFDHLCRSGFDCLPREASPQAVTLVCSTSLSSHPSEIYTYARHNSRTYRLEQEINIYCGHACYCLRFASPSATKSQVALLNHHALHLQSRNVTLHTPRPPRPAATAAFPPGLLDGFHQAIRQNSRCAYDGSGYED